VPVAPTAEVGDMRGKDMGGMALTRGADRERGG
jgi:hypothetical protein